MCDSVPSSTLPPYPSCPGRRIKSEGCTSIRFSCWRPRASAVLIGGGRGEVVTRYSGGTMFRNGGLWLIASTSSGAFGSNRGADDLNTENLSNSIKVSRDWTALESGVYGRDLGFVEKEEQKNKRIELQTGGNCKEEEEATKKNPILKNGIDNRSTSSDGRVLSSVDFIEFDDHNCRTKTAGKLKDDEDYLVKIGESDDDDYDDAVGLKLEELEPCDVRRRRRRRSGRQLTRRSNMIAKQVISTKSALCLGFVSQLWVDTNTWVVLVVEVRPNLLSGELERLFLEDINQVGDVVLIQDESVMENEFRMVGLETLVGYNVVTPGRRNIGKVRGYTFNINSGAVESLELDSFGISIIPSSLVSTYALFVEDVLEVVSDTVVVHEAAASRMQRLTKGFWDSQKVGNSIDELGEYSDQERQRTESANGLGRQRSSSRQNSHPKMREIVDDWELPMDYL